MKVHYINILLFALPLNILEHNKNEPHTTPNHTQTTRSLCECKLYSPTNYDSDPEMKRVMQQFEDRTTQRFHEYDEKMQSKRIQCKDRCDKEIQKIILKDKIEKELMDKFATLQTDIQSDAIPTCVCEKSVADKVEKGCLRCGGVLGGGIAPSVGLLGGIGEAAISAWKPKAIAAAIVSAKKAGAAAGLQAGNAQGMKVVLWGLKEFGVENFFPGICDTISRTGHYANVSKFADTIYSQYNRTCNWMRSAIDSTACNTIEIKLSIRTGGAGTRGPPAQYAIRNLLNGIAEEATQAADATAEAKSTTVAAEITKEKTSEIAATYASWETTIIAAVVAIVVIVLIMLIIYLILRYRRKKKMMKKLQYIKLLEE
ncbi:rifin [Plasmodium falciparum IGH-CR14]|uniref:Rifin n=1 Tax=Plasmodium falciparum IGH-CR14 TaxID=580059 RepID=A0A0L1I784_PLAFA|nr:rifin [Plasmodium falciparum IGH-CR14]